MPETVHSHQSISLPARRVADMAGMALVGGVNRGHPIAASRRRCVIVADANDRSAQRFTRIDDAFSSRGRFLGEALKLPLNRWLRGKTVSFALDVDLANAAICLDRNRADGVSSFSEFTHRSEFGVKSGSSRRKEAETSRPNGRPRLHAAAPLETRIQVILTQTQLERIDRLSGAMLQANPGVVPHPTRGALIRSALEWFVAQPVGEQRVSGRNLAGDSTNYHTKVRLMDETLAQLESLRTTYSDLGPKTSRAAMVRFAMDTFLDAQEAALGASSFLSSSTLEEVPAQECS